MDTAVWYVAAKRFYSLGLGIENSDEEFKKMTWKKRNDISQVSLEYLHSNSWLHDLIINPWCRTRISLSLLSMRMSNKSSKLNISSLPFYPLLPFCLFLPSGSSSRAYKVAGITLLACVLIAGQAMTAYFLLSQGSDIKSLENQNKNLESQMRARPGEENTLSSDRKGCTDIYKWMSRKVA